MDWRAASPMAFFLVGFGLLIHILLWGAGLALLLTPRSWRAGWPALCAPAGLALQSAVVWFGAMSGAHGTQVYGTASVLLPIALLGAGTWKALRERRSLALELRAWRGVALLMAVVLNVLVIPFAVSSKVLTTASLGSCDAADYAAGARLFLEFSRADRMGLLGLTEVVTLHSVDNFYDHFIRLNHFTPSALVALNAGIFSFQPHELISVLTAVFVALSVPTVYWLCRASFRYGSSISGWVAAVYGLSPLLAYAVYQVAMSQLIAAMAIALLTGAVLAVWKQMTETMSRAWRWAGVLAIAYWLLMGAYNFIIIVCLVPAVAYVGWETLRTGCWGRLLRWGVIVLSPLVGVSIVFTQRTLGLLERFMLFQQFDFGWKISALTPEGWLGLVGSVSLAPLPTVLRVSLAGLFLVLLLLALLTGRPGANGVRRLVLAATLPILAGYGYLQLRGHLRGTNASYDAYKLFCVFYPGLLAAFAYWLTLLRTGPWTMRVVAALFAVGVLVLNTYATSRFVRRMQSPPLLVTRPLVQLGQIENLPDVSALNMRIGDFWSRLWANAFLLKKEQYFETHTYEGRRNTELKGTWDLTGGIVSVRQTSLKDRAELRLPPPYALMDTRANDYVRVNIGEGWYDPEALPRADSRWRWTRGDATLVVTNPQSHAVQLDLRLMLRSLVPRDLSLWHGGVRIANYDLGAELRPQRPARLTVPPGVSIIEMRSNVPPTVPGPGDSRTLGVAVYAVEVEARVPDSGQP